MSVSERTGPRADTGAAAVEFALIMVLLLMIVFAAIQYGLYFWSLQAGAAAAREAARASAVGSQNCVDFQNAADGNVGGAAAGAVVASRTYTRADGAPGAEVGGTVDVTISFPSHDVRVPLVPFLDDAEVSQSARARVENVVAGASESC